MTPKFRVGEVVILQSKDHDHCNGEYTVLVVVNGPMDYTCPITGRTIENSANGIGYVLDIDYKDDDGTCRQWAEAVIRKKHQPGDQSFTELMASLKNPVSA
jgi:hypothetical protein